MTDPKMATKLAKQQMNAAAAMQIALNTAMQIHIMEMNGAVQRHTALAQFAGEVVRKNGSIFANVVRIA